MNPGFTSEDGFPGISFSGGYLSIELILRMPYKG
jgi:hypothetical protein